MDQLVLDHLPDDAVISSPSSSAIAPVTLIFCMRDWPSGGRIVAADLSRRRVRRNKKARSIVSRRGERGVFLREQGDGLALSVRAPSGDRLS